MYVTTFCRGEAVPPAFFSDRWRFRLVSFNNAVRICYSPFKAVEGDISRQEPSESRRKVRGDGGMPGRAPLRRAVEREGKVPQYAATGAPLKALRGGRRPG